MIRRLVIFGCILAVVLCFAQIASADVFSFNQSSTGGWSSAPVNCYTCLSINPDGMNPLEIMLFNGIDSDTDGNTHYSGIDVFANVGNTFLISSNEDDPQFTTFADMLTDGESSWFGPYFYDYLGSASGGGWVCSQEDLAHRLGRSEGVELYGYTVRNFGLTINSASRWYDVNAEYPYKFSWDLTYFITADPIVPEPASIVPILCGILGIALIKHNKSVF